MVPVQPVTSHWVQAAWKLTPWNEPAGLRCGTSTTVVPPFIVTKSTLVPGANQSDAGLPVGAGPVTRRKTRARACSTSSASSVDASSASPKVISPATAAGAPAGTAPQSRHSTSPSRRTRCTLAHSEQRSRSVIHSPSAWQAGQMSTWRSALTPRSQGLLPRSGSTCRVPHR
jgi:hypothetical protein